MTKNDLIQELNSFRTAERKNRDKAANFVITHPETFPYLLEICFEKKGRISVKAAWILEIVCECNLSLLYPHLSNFSSKLSLIEDDSALRPLSKICNFLATKYNSGKDTELNNTLDQTDKEKITEVNFDWLIGDRKVAIKAFAMDTLYLFGKEYSWIHPELKLILQQNIVNESPGYLSRAKKILSRIAKDR